MFEDYQYFRENLPEYTKEIANFFYGYDPRSMIIEMIVINVSGYRLPNIRLPADMTVTGESVKLCKRLFLVVILV